MLHTLISGIVVGSNSSNSSCWHLIRWPSMTSLNQMTSSWSYRPFDEHHDLYHYPKRIIYFFISLHDLVRYLIFSSSMFKTKVYIYQSAYILNYAPSGVNKGYSWTRKLSKYEQTFSTENCLKTLWMHIYTFFFHEL